MSFYYSNEKEATKLGEMQYVLEEKVNSKNTTFLLQLNRNIELPGSSDAIIAGRFAARSILGPSKSDQFIFSFTTAGAGRTS